MRYGFLKRPKYVITREVVHPSVLKVTQIKDGISYYVMALTPYPNMDARYENPSIIFSNDGIQWYEGRVRNPIFPPPKNAVPAKGPHNCDPEILFHSKLKKAFLYFIHYGDGYKHIRVLTSNDFINWKVLGSTNIETILSSNEIRCSPSIVYLENEDRFILFIVRADLDMKNVHRIEVLTSNDGLSWHKIGEASGVPSSYEGSYFFPWHISVRKVDEEYWMIAAMNHGTLSYPPMYLFFFRSYDGIHWEAYEHPLLITSHSGFDDGKLYRADFLVDNGEIHIWYSAMSRENKFSIGYISGKTRTQKSRSNNIVLY
jgi:sucrose-6-phosphate hydrolase SacC (GH32 family)